MILQAWLTLPSCLASSSRPTLLRMTFWSFVIVGSPLAPPPGRGDIAPPRRLSAHRYHLIRQIKSRLLHLITELSRYHELFVIARNSSFQYRGKSVDVKRVGRELGVEYLVEGSLRKAGNRLRVTAQLVEAATGNHIWADKYDRDLADVFTIQDEVTQTIANTLVERLAGSGLGKLPKKPKELWASYDYFSRGREHLVKYDTQSAMPLLQRAIELDPGYAQAYALLSDCYTTSYFDDYDEIKLHTAIAYARKALSTDETDGLCHY